MLNPECIFIYESRSVRHYYYYIVGHKSHVECNSSKHGKYEYELTMLGHNGKVHEMHTSHSMMMIIIIISSTITMYAFHRLSNMNDGIKLAMSIHFHDRATAVLSAWRYVHVHVYVKEEFDSRRRATSSHVVTF